MLTAMIVFTTSILQFEEKGEKTGWTYIAIPSGIAGRIKPGHKKSFRVKGSLDDYAFEGVSLLPMGEGNFIMPLNGAIRKAIHKRKGAKLRVRMEEDNKPLKPPAGFMESLQDEPEALAYFNSLAGSHRNYFMKWIAAAKTEQTRIRRIALAVNAFIKKQDYGAMIRANKGNQNDF
ncbi:MAG: YdeI/OmpD-associated family protein [Flavitalea sp.]